MLPQDAKSDPTALSEPSLNSPTHPCVLKHVYDRSSLPLASPFSLPHVAQQPTVPVVSVPRGQCVQLKAQEQ